MRKLLPSRSQTSLILSKLQAEVLTLTLSMVQVTSGHGDGVIMARLAMGKQVILMFQFKFLVFQSSVILYNLTISSTKDNTVS
ncbi:hypothetical protein SBF1_4920004 [Candidatus Desulfosporosinus infrequens]|uniref:Uncharacterized protein n=1 Tax=Candidatus Desulfosporosinus infrequens TaxID=2043169 RepID=A0A2U3LGN1_9FIRM|nr:hypothetical protein SBF1_4920004 [Candidatus Desulfosporosinus infrequens]